MSIDIYMLYKHIYSDIFDISHDYDYGGLKFVKSEKDFMCEGCNKTTVYLTNENKCPSCSYQTHRLKCDYCYRNISCVSCGGKAKKMIQVDYKVFCRNNRCLMPFGYFINYENSKCTCNILTKLDICKDLQVYASKFIPKNHTCWEKRRRLPDLHVTNPDNCTHCIINNKYKDVSGITAYQPNKLTCNCY